MKTVFRIFGILVIVTSLAMGALSISRIQDDKENLAKQLTEAKEKIAEYKLQVGEVTGETKVIMDDQLAKFEKNISNLPSESTYLIMQIFMAVLLIMATAFGVFLFRPNFKTLQLAGAAAIVTTIIYFIAPDIKRGAYGGMDDKTMALAVGIPTVFAGIFAYLVAKKNVFKQL